MWGSSHPEDIGTPLGEDEGGRQQDGEEQAYRLPAVGTELLEGGTVGCSVQQVVAVEEVAGSTPGGNFGPPHTLPPLEVVSGGQGAEEVLQCREAYDT